VCQVFTLAHELGCKGVTIYRDGSRDQQVLSTGKTATGVAAAGVAATGAASTKAGDSARHEVSAGQRSGAGAQAYPPRPVHKRRPLILSGKTVRMETGCGSLYVTINEDDEGVFEVFNTMGKAGGCAASQCEAIGRLISLAWRSGVDVDRVVKQLRGIHCQKPFGFGDNRVNSCADAIGRAIQTFLKTNGGRVTEVRNFRNGEACPACGGPVEHEGGCTVCRDCGYSNCE
jgi:ribonucleoside-diphosphate reductase alpha chain